MEYLAGAVLALAVGIGATFVGLDRDRAFYPTVTIVIASYYALFAAMGGGGAHVFALESIFIAAFVGAAVAGFKRSPWLLVGALFAHGVFDLVHGRLIANPGVPAWWPAWCFAYDAAAAAYLAWILSRRGSQ